MIPINISWTKSYKFAYVGTIFMCKASQLLCTLASNLQPKHVFLGRTQHVSAGATTDTAPATEGVAAPLLGSSPSTYRSRALHRVALTAYTTPLCVAPSAA